MHFWPQSNFFCILRVLKQNSEYFQKSPKVAKNHKNIQINEFLVPQLLRFKDSETIWKKCIFLPQSHFSVFLRILKQNSEYFQKSPKIAKNHKNIQIHEFLIPQLLRFKDPDTIWKKCIFGPKATFSVFWGYLSKILNISKSLPKSPKITKIYKSMNF